MDFNNREAHLSNGGPQRPAAGSVASRIDQSSVNVLVVGIIQGVDYLSLDIGVENLHINSQSLGISFNLLINLTQSSRAKDFHLGLASHVHARSLDYQDFSHKSSLIESRYL